MRFIHASDLHLGMIPDGQKSWGRERSNALLSSLDKIVDLALKENVDALFLLGQSFHFSPLKEDVERIRQSLSRIPFCHVFFYSKPDLSYHFLNSAIFPRNVHILKEEQEQLYIEELNLEILSLQEKADRKRALEHFTPEHSGAIPVLLCNVSREEPFPQNPEKLQALPFSYVALGGEADKQILLADKVVFSGSPEALSKDNLGEHGVFLGNLNPLQKKIDALQFIRLADTQYISLHFRLDTGVGSEMLRDRLSDEIKKRGMQHIYRIKFSGKRDPETHVGEDLLPQNSRVIEWIDESVPEYDFYNLYREHSNDLIGFYIRSYLKKGNENLSAREKDCLHYGISALLSGGKK